MTSASSFISASMFDGSASKCNVLTWSCFSANGIECRTGSAAVPEGHLDGAEVCSVVVEEPCEASAQIVRCDDAELCLVGSVGDDGADQSGR